MKEVTPHGPYMIFESAVPYVITIRSMGKTYQINMNRGAHCFPMETVDLLYVDDAVVCQDAPSMISFINALDGVPVNVQGGGLLAYDGIKSARKVWTGSISNATADLTASVLSLPVGSRWKFDLIYYSKASPTTFLKLSAYDDYGDKSVVDARTYVAGTAENGLVSRPGFTRKIAALTDKVFEIQTTANSGLYEVALYQVE